VDWDLRRAGTPPTFRKQNRCRHQPAGEAVKPEIFIEPEGRLILRVDDKREDRRLRPHRAGDRIDDERGAQAPPAKLLVNGGLPIRAAGSDLRQKEDDLRPRLQVLLPAMPGLPFTG
jgi:hypothetical protein